MSMKVTRLSTHWSGAEAWTAIEMLDLLRDALWEDYGDQITEMFWEELADGQGEDAQLEIPFDDDIPF